MKTPTHFKGIAWFISHMLIGTFGALLVRVLTKDFHVFQVVFMYSFTALLFLLPWAFNKGTTSLKSNKPRAHFLRGILGFASFAFWVKGLSLIPLADAAALAQSTPLLTTLLAILLLSEPISKNRIAPLLVGFIGAIIILRPGTTAFDYGSLFIVGAVVVRAISDIISKKLVKIDSAKINVLYLFIFMTILSFPLASMDWKAPTSEHIPIIIILGITSSATILSMMKAYEYEDLSVLMPFSFIGLLSMFCAGYIAFNEVVDKFTLIGGTIIILSCVYMFRIQHTRMKEIIHDPGE